MVALILLGVGRIVATYDVFWQTWDESAHVAAGMQWLDQGKYTYERLHPPLARVAVALGPFLGGRRSMPRSDIFVEGNAILEDGGQYAHTLKLARAGVIPFFMLSAVVVWLWTCRLYGHNAGVLAVGLYTFLPLVLAHAGNATTDMAVAATLSAYFLVLTATVEQPTPARAVLTGLSGGVALLSKLSALVFLPLGTMVILASYLWSHRKGIQLRGRAKTFSRYFALSLAASIVTVWAGYRFSFGIPFLDRPGLIPEIQRRLHAGPGTLLFVKWLSRIPVPAPEFFEGVGSLAMNNAEGRRAFFLGEISTTGWRTFFPILTLVKIPLAFLVLSAGGLLSAMRSARDGRTRWDAPLPCLLSLVMLGAVVPSSINIGLRHLLPMFPLLAIVAADGAGWLYRSLPRLVNAAVVASLLVWYSLSSLGAHPDYLAYFNALAGSHPERIVVDSDLDWGQDAKRLVAVLREAGFPPVSVAYNGWVDLEKRGVLNVTMLEEKHPVTGLVAISVHEMAMLDYSWLKGYEPARRIGKSILLYRIPPS